MVKRAIVPPAPKPEEITPSIKNLLEKWIDYFRRLSPRIVIKTPFDEGFDLAELKRLAQSNTAEWARDEPESVELDGWPTVDQIAFCVSYDSSKQERNKIFRTQDTYLFCFGDIAFGLGYFEYDEYDDEIEKYRHHLSGYSKIALSWRYITKLIRDRIKEIETGSLPPLPQ